MKTLLITLVAAAISFTAPRAVAKDSTCLIGDNGKVGITTFEHRAEASTRRTEVMVIFGMHYLIGHLSDTDSGKITLKESGKNGYTYSGTISVDYDKMTVSLKGKIKMSSADGDTYDINSSFQCRGIEP